MKEMWAEGTAWAKTALCKVVLWSENCKTVSIVEVWGALL